MFETLGLEKIARIKVGMKLVAKQPDARDRGEGGDAATIAAQLVRRRSDMVAYLPGIGR